MKNVTQKQATQIQHWLNDYPRHIFDGKTAFEMFMQELPAMNLHNPKRIVNFLRPAPIADKTNSKNRLEHPPAC